MQKCAHTAASSWSSVCIANELSPGLISYSEATRYSADKHADAATWCKANNKPIPQHTLYPRTKGFIATVNHLRSAAHIKAVYDVTIAYASGSHFMSAPNIWETLSTPNMNNSWRFHVDVQRYMLEDLPRTDEELAAWLEERWMEKGRRLESMRQDLVKGLPWLNITST